MADPKQMMIFAEVRDGVLRIELCDQDKFVIDVAEVSCADIVKAAKNPPEFETG